MRICPYYPLQFQIFEIHWNTLDGRNLSPDDGYFIPLFMRFQKPPRWRSPDFWTIKSTLWDHQWLTMSRTLAWKKVPPQDPASFADLSFLGDSRETLPGFFGDGDGARKFKSHGIMEWWNKITLRRVIVGNANLKCKLEQALLSLLRISINFDWIHKTVSNRDS